MPKKKVEHCPHKKYVKTGRVYAGKEDEYKCLACNATAALVFYKGEGKWYLLFREPTFQVEFDEEPVIRLAENPSPAAVKPVAQEILL